MSSVAPAASCDVVDRRGAAPADLRSSERLPFAVKLSWGLGQLAPVTVFSIVSAQLLVYLTDQVGIAPVVAGLILFGAKLYDAVSDVVIGIWSDRTVSRWGRRRPWMAAGSVVLAVSLILMFHVDQAGAASRTAAATAAVLIFFTGVSLFTIPHLAISAEATSDYHERTSIQVHGAVFGILANLIGISIAPLLMFGTGAERYHNMALILSPLPLVAGLICVAVMARISRGASPPRAPMPVRLWLRSFARNGPLLALLVTKALHLISTAMMLGAVLYYCIHVLKIGQRGMVVFGAVGAAGGFLGVFVVARFLARANSKHRLYGVMLLGMAASMLLFLLVPPGNIWAFAVPPFLLTVMAAPGLMLASSMVADVAEHDAMANGVHRAGAITAAVSTVQKAAPAFAALLVGGVLSLGGYRAGATSQPADAVRAIMLCTSILPGILLLVASIPMLFFYRLDEGELHRQRGRTAGG